MPHRYFTTEIADGTAVLRGTDAHHLARVMRARMTRDRWWASAPRSTAVPSAISLVK